MGKPSNSGAARPRKPLGIVVASQKGPRVPQLRLEEGHVAERGDLLEFGKHVAQLVRLPAPNRGFDQIEQG